VLSTASVWAEFSTSPEAAPVSLAPRFTSEMLSAISWVPLAALCTFLAISWVADVCCSIAVAMLPAMREIWPMVWLIS